MTSITITDPDQSLANLTVQGVDVPTVVRENAQRVLDAVRCDELVVEDAWDDVWILKLTIENGVLSDEEFGDLAMMAQETLEDYDAIRLRTGADGRRLLRFEY